MPDTTDNDLIIASRNGDRQAFNMLVLKHQSMVHRVISRMVDDHDVAQDLTQDVFIKAWLSMNAFRGDSLVSTWLYRIATNLTLNHLRRQSLRTFFRLDGTEHLDIPDNNDGADVQLEKSEQRRLIQEAMERLPHKQRAVFVLRYFEELPYADISTILETSVGALKANYFHAVRKIQEHVRHAM